MKKVCLIVFFISLAVYAYPQRFHGGAFGGFVVSQLDGDQLGGYNKPGVRVGGWVNTDVSDITTLQLELEYIQKGSKISQNRIVTENYYHSRLNYLQVSIPAKFLIEDKWKVEAGLAGGYLYRAQEDDGNGFLDAHPAFNKFELSFLAGLNYRINEKFTGNVRFNYTVFLLPVRPHPGDQKRWPFNLGQYNNVLAFTLYYQID